MKFTICTICQKAISKEEEIVFCPFWHTQYHKLEFLEWLKVNAKCKACKRELDMWEFQKHLEEHKHRTKHLKLCNKCLKEIPTDAEFCIYCGDKTE